MRDLLVVLPIALLFAASATCLVCWHSPRAQRTLALGAFVLDVGLAILLLIAVTHGGPITLQIGGVPAPLGITFRADLAAAIMTVVAATIGLATAIYAVGDVPSDQQRQGFWPLVLLLVLGVTGAFLTSDLFNLFVWFEVLLLASFVLLSLGTTRAQLGGAHIYVLLSLIGSTLFLISVGLTYGAVRTLDLGQLAERLATLQATRPDLVVAIQALLLVAFGIKAAVFPLMFWLPASYHTPPPAVSALFSALLTKVGVYAMIRVTGTVFPTSDGVHTALVLVAIATMSIGVLGALGHGHFRRILGIHIVSQIGYMVAGLAVANTDPAARRFAIAAALFYMVHNLIVKANLYLVAGIVHRLRGTETLSKLGGVARGHPYLAALFLISALSLAGIPPLSGFWAKLAIIGAGLERGRVGLVIVAVVVGLLTLTSMLKIWLGAFAGDPVSPDRRSRTGALVAMYAASTLLAALTLAISVAPDMLFRLALEAADQLAPPPVAPLWSGGTP